MIDKQNTKFSDTIKNFLYPINIYNNLKKLYFSIIPKGSKAYDFTHSFLNVFLKQLHLFNIYYREWIRKFDTLSNSKIESVKKQIAMMDEKPHISIIMPVFNPPVDLLKQAILSCIDQIYPYWELCIADDASTNLAIPEIIHQFTQKDSRIRAVFREKNGHISAASNSALSLASHDFIALLDHDDLLHPLALFYAAKVINKHPDSVIIYSDEDKITKRGKRLDPYFKPDFNYELLLSQNMVSHLGIYRTETVRKVGGFRLGFEGSQDYDLVLRVSECCTPEQIHHIPRPLYHWRIIKESAAHNVNIKPYAIDAGFRAISEHLHRRNVDANIEFLGDVAAYSVNYPPPSPLPSVTIILPLGKISDQESSLVESIIKKTDYPNFQLLISMTKEDQCDFHKLNEVEKHKLRVFFDNSNVDKNYSKLVNKLVNETTSEYICLVDATVKQIVTEWLNSLVAQGSQDRIGVVAPKLINSEDDRIFSCGMILLPNDPPQHISKGEEKDLNGYFGWAKLKRGYSVFSEKCLVFKRKDFVSVNGFSENLITPLYSCVDFCLKLREKGYRNIFCPSIELDVHPGYQNQKNNNNFKKQMETDRKTTKSKWQTWYQKDPAFNPNLTFLDEGKLLVNLLPDLQALEINK